MNEPITVATQWQAREAAPVTPLTAARSLSRYREWFPKTVTAVPALQQLIQTRGDLSVPAVDHYVGIASENNLTTYMPAIELLTNAIANKQRIVVALDYDCDGQTAGACMIKTLRACSADVTWVVPNRLEHGYGLNVELITNAAAPGALVITVDNGITNHDEVKELKQQGYIVVITDHHLPEEVLPEADAIVDPKVNLTEEDDEYMVPGVFVAAKTALHTAKQFVDEDTWGILLSYCNCLVGLGIVSDVIELHPEIRAQLLVSLAELNSCPFLGLQSLLLMSGIKDNQPLTSTQIAYYVAPKLNAAGRMGKAEIGVELLLLEGATERERTEAMLKANALKFLNSERKIIERTIYDEALEMAEAYVQQHRNSVVLYKPEWHLGVLGIIAARIAEQFHKPTLILAGDGEELEGSGRSVDDFDLYTCLANCSDTLTRFGGHLVAAGVGLNKNNLETFRQRFDTEVAKLGIPEVITYQYDAVITLRELLDIRWQLFLQNIEPCGNLNPNVVVRVNRVQVATAETKRDALYLLLCDADDWSVSANRYHAPDEWNQYLGKVVDVLINPQPLYFSGTTLMDYRIVDIKLSEIEQEEEDEDEI